MLINAVIKIQVFSLFICRKKVSTVDIYLVNISYRMNKICANEQKLLSFFIDPFNLFYN